MILPVVAALFGVVSMAVTIDGTSCLEAADVEAALQGLLPDGAERAALTVEVLPSVDTLVVRVRNRDGDLIAEHALRPLTTDQATCKQRASEIAVVIAAAAVPEGPAPVHADAEPATSPAPPAVEVISRAAPQPPRRLLDVGVTAGASLAAGELVPAARVEVDVPTSGALLIRVSGLYDGEHREDVGRGEVAWSRWGAACALASRRPVGTGGLAVSAAAELAATWRAISGRGFVETDRSWSFDPGAGVDARLLWKGRRFSSWLAVSAMAWPRPQQVFVRGIVSDRDLPRWDLFAGIGGAFGVR